MSVSKNDILFWIGLVSAIWFGVMGLVWTYNAALVIAYPFGIISYLIWRSLRSDNKPRNRYIIRILAIGLAFSLLVLAGFWIFE